MAPFLSEYSKAQLKANFPILSSYDTSKLPQSHEMNTFYIWSQDLLCIIHIASNLELILSQLLFQSMK